MTHILVYYGGQYIAVWEEIEQYCKRVKDNLDKFTL
jgi:hypothetical protein